MNHPKHECKANRIPIWSFLGLLLLLIHGLASAAPKPKLLVTKAGWSAKKNQLVIKGVVKQGTAGAPIEIFDLNGRRLGQANSSPFVLTLQGQELPNIPCAIRVESGKLENVKKVVGAPKSCLKAPTCQILTPDNSTALKANQNVAFEARANLKDKRAGSLKTEWDFAGGVMQTDAQRMNLQGSNNLKTEAVFLRDNSRYRVRFSATDAKNRRCEDSIEVAVGTPPNGLPAKVAEQPVPDFGGELDGSVGDLVVLPFEDLTMQSFTDARLAPNQYVTIWPFSSLNAEVYRKDRLPVKLSPQEIVLSYSAASNPADPVGADSINSTSQNWPVGSALMDAELQKSDLFEPFAPESPPADLTSWSFLGSLQDSRRSGDTLLPDEGFAHYKTTTEEDNRGSYMPGITNPYQVNEPQSYRNYDSDQATFRATLLPLSDIDDAGRVNPYPLLRSEARLTGEAPVRAATDAVLTSSRDLHCRECHEKGGIAANPAADLSLFKIADAFIDEFIGDGQPQFFAAPSDRLDDRELAAYWNIASIHDFYDRVGLASHARVSDDHSGHGGHGGGSSEYKDQQCSVCHMQWQGAALGDDATGMYVSHPSFQSVAGNAHPYSFIREGGREGELGYDDSAAMHVFHGQLMYNADRTGIRRWPGGRFKRWSQDDGPNPAPLFPVVNAEGKPLPMEENCLKCHGGQREQAYRDHHYAAGLTCYQCHGDMLAVGGFYQQFSPTVERKNFRMPWFDQPECGACHLGSANRGVAGTDGVFSAGVMDTAFDPADPSATLRQPGQGPDGMRFAVPRDSFTLHNVAYIDPKDPAKSVQLPLFRRGKDTHGNVSCAACHGGAHAIWPNKDPSSNDNVTAMQLQGHTGSVLECNVCHSANAFAKLKDLDGGTYMGVPEGVLGGPHNLHPINDANWWKQADGDTPTSSGKSAGGWHNDYAKLPGAAGEDQCAACHGNDHKGSRLSKTPVAREFIDEKGKKVRVQAGQEIGCDLCHSIKKSCTHSPNPRCGSADVEPVNRSPVFTSVPVEQVVLGEMYRAVVSASDPDGDPVTLRLTVNPTPPNPDSPDSAKLEFDAATGNLTADWMLKEGANSASFRHKYVITADDGRGGRVHQIVKVRLACPTNLLLDPEVGCVKLRFTSRQPVFGVNEGEVFSYAMKTAHADQLPVTFSLAEDAPAGVTLSPEGVITWNTTGISEETPGNFNVTAKDSSGTEVTQSVSVTVCNGAKRWNDISATCIGPIAITSPPPISSEMTYGMNIGETFVHHATAKHKQGLPLSFALSGAPTGMGIGTDSGHLEWIAVPGSEGAYVVELRATDGAGAFATQTFRLAVCATPQVWSPELSSCKGPISIISAPPGGGAYGMDVGQTLIYDVTATHEQNLPLTFSIDAGPAGLSIDANSGHIEWTADVGSVGSSQFVTVSARDGQGGVEQQSFYLSVCNPPTHWDISMNSCIE